MNIIEENYDCFTVYKNENEEDYSFHHIKIKDNEIFYKSLFDYFFSEDRLLRYTENNSNLKFHKSHKNYVRLYKELLKFIDEENLQIDIKEFDKSIDSILTEEFKVENKNGKNIIRIDKYGKVGEYIFSCILSEYFQWDCVIPKLNLVTNNNMSIFGIDTLFYSERDNIIFFGESKVSNSITNGVLLIQYSLKDYQKKIEQEYLLVLSERTIKKSRTFSKKFEKDINKCMLFKDFITKAELKNIGIPIFIAHGKEIDNYEIFTELKNIPRNDICNLNTKYYVISLPIINKDKMMAVFTKAIRDKEEVYKDNV